MLNINDDCYQQCLVISYTPWCLHTSSMIAALATLSYILGVIAGSYIPLQCHTEIQVIQVTRYGTVCTTHTEPECDNNNCRKLHRTPSDRMCENCQSDAYQEEPRKVCKEVQVEIPKQVRKKVCQKIVSWWILTNVSFQVVFCLPFYNSKAGMNRVNLKFSFKDFFLPRMTIKRI